jgi:membrane protease YdiL (CAAX protease family)
MTPPDPFLEAPALPSPPPKTPFWDYSDLAFLITLAFPTLFLSLLLVRGLSKGLDYGQAFQGMLAQILWYLLVFTSLMVILRIRYDAPFWQSLGWKTPYQGTAASFLAGPFLAIGVGLLGYVLRTPEIESPFNQMLANRPTVVLFGIFVVILGPLCEELAFRGFLMPLLARSFGAVAGIVLSSLTFGGLHAQEYAWSWRHVFLVSVAGTVFGWTRYKTGSTAASTFMHSTYNLTQFAAFMAQQAKAG